MMTATKMAVLDLAQGVFETCTVCGAEHTDKSPVCADCAFGEWVSAQEERPEAQEEPLSYEAMAF